jgi:hypothetical protein
MLAAVIRATGSASALGATFATLIPGVTHGLLGHAVVLDPAGASEIERLAEAVGAGFVAGDDWLDGIGAARGEWLMLLDAGDLPGINWPAAVERHLQVAPTRASLLPREGWAASLAERFGRGLRPGLVLPRDMARAGRVAGRVRRLQAIRERV